jgi:hypothetical protein
MATENSLWGEERIANELRLKLGIRVSPRTVRKYMPKRPLGRPRGDQRWATFLRNHAKAIIACDFFVAVTATFRLLYVFVLIHHDSRAGCCTSTSLRILQRPGRYSSSGRRSVSMAIAISFTIGTTSSRRAWMNQSNGSASES